MTKIEEIIINDYKKELIMAVALCDAYKIDYELYFKEKYLYKTAYSLKRSKFNATSTTIKLLELWQRMRLYIDIYEKYKNSIMINNELKRIINNIESIIKNLDLFFGNDIIKLSTQRKEMKENAKKNYNKEYRAKKKGEEII